MIYLQSGFVILLAASILLILCFFRQNRRLTEITKAIADIVANRSSQLLFTDKNDTIGKLTFEINKIISCYRSEKLDLEKEHQVRNTLLPVRLIANNRAVYLLHRNLLSSVKKSCHKATPASFLICAVSPERRSCPIRAAFCSCWHARAFAVIALLPRGAYLFRTVIHFSSMSYISMPF